MPKGILTVAAASAALLASAPLGGQQRRMAPAPAAHPVAAPVQAAFRSVLQRPVVDVTLDGEGPFPFILDTGAMASLVRADLVADLDLPRIGRAMVGDPSGGAPTTVEVYVADQLGVAGAAFPAVNLLALEDPGFFASIGDVAGVLSVNALAGNVVALDFGTGTLRLTAGGLSEGDGSQAYAGDLPIPSLDIDVAGHAVRADLDTGNGRGLTLPEAYRDSLTLRGGLEVDTLHLLTGASEAWRGVLDGAVTVAGHTVESPPVTFQGSFPQGNVGSDFLEGLRLEVDPLGRRFRLTRSRAEGAAPTPRASSARATRGAAADSAAVRAVALDYIEGWFAGDAGRMERALHPGLVKEIQGADGSIDRVGATEMVERTRGMGQRGAPAPSLAGATHVLALFGDVASVRIDAPDWVDLLHLVRTEDGWKILQVLWTLR